MKGRPFLAGLLIIAVLALGLGWGGWWLVWERGPLELQHHPLTVPRAARFIPRQAPLSLYILSDGQQPVDYARAIAPLRQRDKAAQAVERLRDGAFAAAGLDYHDELAQWLAPEIALALFDPPEAEPTAASWLLVLRSADDGGARRFLQRFWQSRSLAGSGLQVSQYRGMGLISGQGALVGREPVPLATALVQDDLVLLASGRTTLERALDVSQIQDLNQTGLAPLRQGAQEWGEGLALLVARSGALGPWLGFPSLDRSMETAGTLLVGALQPHGQELTFEGRLHFPGASVDPRALPPPSSDGAANSTAAPASSTPPPASAEDVWETMPAELPLLQRLQGDSSSLAVLRNPAALLAVPWLKPLVELITTPTEAGPLPPLIAAADPGLLLMSTGPEGWLIGTSNHIPPVETLEAPLAAQGLIDAPLEVGEETVTVWTRLRTSDNPGGKLDKRDQLQASVAGWRRESDGVAWWGGHLALLNGQTGARSIQLRQRQLAELDRPRAPLRWVLGPEHASALLHRWEPWTLLSSLSGGPLAQGLQSLAIAIEPDGTTVRCTARLRFAEALHG
jgi:hypothetical protein